MRLKNLFKKEDKKPVDFSNLIIGTCSSGKCQYDDKYYKDIYEKVKKDNKGR